MAYATTIDGQRNDQSQPSRTAGRESESLSAIELRALSKAFLQYMKADEVDPATPQLRAFIDDLKRELKAHKPKG